MNCEARDIVNVGSVAPGHGRILIPVTSEMQGACILYVFETNRHTFKSDMHLFFVSTMSYCPRDVKFNKFFKKNNFLVFNKFIY